MRIYIHFSNYRNVLTIHCLAADLRTVVGPFKDVESEKTFFKLLTYVGADAELAKDKLKERGHGGVWADCPYDRLRILGIKRR
jgi:hypothetical protein